MLAFGFLGRDWFMPLAWAKRHACESKVLEGFRLNRRSCNDPATQHSSSQRCLEYITYSSKRTAFLQKATQKAAPLEGRIWLKLAKQAEQRVRGTLEDLQKNMASWFEKCWSLTWFCLSLFFLCLTKSVFRKLCFYFFLGFLSQSELSCQSLDLLICVALLFVFENEKS